MTVRVIFLDAEGARRTVHGEIGDSIMKCATRNQIPGILGECGGAMACATCHSYIDPAWQGLVGPPTSVESEMLEGCLDHGANSRLTCQILLTEALDGIIVRTPRSQV